MMEPAPTAEAITALIASGGAADEAAATAALMPIHGWSLFDLGVVTMSVNWTFYNGAPTAAMWTDLIANLFLLAIASSDAGAYFFILAVSNCGYIIFNYLNLNAGWTHRIDAGHVARPYKAPTFILALGGIFAFVNAVLMGAGAEVWNPNALIAGIIAAAISAPVFA